MRLDPESDAFKLYCAKSRIHFLSKEITVHEQDYAKQQYREAYEHLRLLARDIISETTNPHCLQ